MVIVHAYRGRVSAYISALRPTLAPRRGPFFILAASQPSGDQTSGPCQNQCVSALIAAATIRFTSLDAAS